jgi:hypothetical protein
MYKRFGLMSNDDELTASVIIDALSNPVDSNCLPCTEETRSNAMFIGEKVPCASRGIGAVGTAAHPVISIQSTVNTPLGGCKDSLYGDKAPKDGTHCSNFLNCLNCASYSIAGSEKDLHRLFSFYWFLGAERKRARSRDWAERFVMLMGLIDKFTREKFNPELVASAKDAARINPLKFWKSCQIEAGNDINHFRGYGAMTEGAGINI